MVEIIRRTNMLGMNRLQLRYFRNVLTAWVILGFAYFCFWWAIPFTLASIYVTLAIGTFIYGLWFFSTSSVIYEIDWIATDKGTEGIHILDKPTLDVWDSLTDDEKNRVRKIARKTMGY
jgi:hypothetical protein